MTDAAIPSLLLGGIPLLGAAFSFVVWSNPDRLRNWSVIVSILSLAAAVGLSAYLTCHLRVFADLSSTGCRLCLSPRTAGSPGPSTALVYDLAISWAGHGRPHKPETARPDGLDAIAGSDCCAALPPPYPIVAHFLVGHRHLCSCGLVCRNGHRHSSTAFFGRVLAGLHNLVAARAVS